MRFSLQPVFAARVAALTIVAGVLAGALGGCVTVPQGRAAIDTVKVHGNSSVASNEITDRLATAESPKFLGFFRGIVYDYAIYDESVLQRDLARVERYYRGRGFFDARARAARVTHLAPDHVRVDIVVDEGPPMLNRDVSILGVEGLPAADAAAVRDAAHEALPVGVRFDEDDYKKAQSTVLGALTDRGYAYASLKANAQGDLAAHAIDYSFEVTPKIPATFGKITFLGLDPDGDGPKEPFLEEKLLRRAVDIREGGRYSTARIAAAQQALLELQVFSSVSIEPSLADPPSPIVPLVVKVEPAALHLLRLGGGFEVDTIKTDIHALVGWENRNFLGGMRDLNVQFRPGLVLYPTRIGSGGSFPPDAYLPQEYLRVGLRQPGFLEARTVGFIQPEFNVFPLIVPTNPDSTPPPPVGYVEPKASIGLTRRFGKRFTATLAYNVQGEIPFEYPATQLVDPGLLHPIVLLYPQLITVLDFRDNAIHPHKGIYLSNDLQVAGLPGSAPPNNGTSGETVPGDVRVQPEIRGYVPLARDITLSLRGTIGFIFAATYGNAFRDDLNTVNAGGNVTPTSQLNSDIQTIYFRGFYSGGPDSNRGFPYRGASPHAAVPFLTPSTAAAQTQLCQIPKGMKDEGAIDTSSSCLIPVGGFSLWEASAEVRFDITGPLGAAVFCDAGAVSANYFQFLFSHLHLSCGAGARYDTPVGPIRLDVGYRIPPLQILGFANEDAARQAFPTEGTQPQVFNINNIAISFGIGEAF
jgi:outer membrane protein assembly factor BamA